MSGFKINDFRILPTNDMTTSEQLDCLIRVVILVFIFSLIFDLNTTFNLILLFIIIILCYIKEKMSEQKENFTYSCDTTSSSNYIDSSPYRYPQQGLNYLDSDNKGLSSIQNNPPVYRKAKITQNGSILENVNRNPFAYDAVELDVNNENYVSNNYKLVGSANPKTFIPPVITPPISDLSYWKSNNLVTHSHINDGTNVDIYQSGYAVSNFCGDNQCPKNPNIDFLKNNSKYKKIDQGKHDFNNNFNGKYHQKYAEHQKNTHTHLGEPHYDMKFNNIKENFSFEEFDTKNKINNVGLVNKSCGFSQDQPQKNGLPVNLTVGNCDKSPNLKEYNKNLFTQTIQPGVYTINQVNEPINSNIGISFTQQFEPLTYDFGDGLTYTQHDPLDPDFNQKDNILKYDINEVIEPITQSNVYDPRFSGYGTSYRAYTDENIGQTKFFYDDIDSIRMPNYVIRSKIDFADFADTYGPMNSENGNSNNSNIRSLANQKFLDDSLTFRTGMQERLMRKVNSDAWQQRQKPIYKTNQRMLGGKGMF
jgi:hypothetical protein